MLVMFGASGFHDRERRRLNAEQRLAASDVSSGISWSSMAAYVVLLLGYGFAFDRWGSHHPRLVMVGLLVGLTIVGTAVAGPKVHRLRDAGLPRDYLRAFVILQSAPIVGVTIMFVYLVVVS